MEGFSWTVSGATILMFIGWAGTLGLWLFRRGGREQAIEGKVESAHTKLDAITTRWDKEKDAFDRHVADLDVDRRHWRDGIEKDLDQRFAGVIGQVNLLRDQHGEMRENIALNYMTRPEIAALESRVTEGQGRIIDRLERFDGRLSDMQKSILEAIRRTPA